MSRDHHSYSNPEQVRVTHVELDLEVDFAKKTLRGTARLTLGEHSADSLVLDTRDLRIERVEVAGQEAPFTVGAADPILGAPLTVALAPGAREVNVHYETSPGAGGLQWLEPAQTAGGKEPYLYSQSEPILARTWIPLQDSPGVRVTYAARIRTPRGLRAVMSAELQGSSEDEYRFRMPHAVPSYLIALAAGDLAFQATGKRTGVWAEPSVVAKAAKEFEDTEAMVAAVESLYGPYRWGRYDILVCPPSFPIGGMENPCLTFATPTILAGDKSLVALVSHELAHSWSGNLVSNATWSDFWLNESFTVYLEWRIQEKVYGRARSEMEGLISVGELKREMAKLPEADQILHVDLKGRDPDDGFTLVPYIKGALFLRLLEETYGRERFDAFLKGYFEHFAFRSITTADCLEHLKANLLGDGAAVGLEEWVFQPGLPSSAPLPQSDALNVVGAAARAWQETMTLPRTEGWTTHEWLYFLRSLPEKDTPGMAELDNAFGLTKTGNAEILCQWLLMAVRNAYQAADARLEEFLMTVGRRKFVKPLYEELVKSGEGRAKAEGIFARARERYHPMTAGTVAQVLGKG